MNLPAPTETPPASPRPLRLPRLGRNEAQAHTLLAQRALGCALALGEPGWQLSLEPLLAPPLAAPAPDPASWQIEAQWAGARFTLTLPACAGELWVKTRFPGLDLPALPPAFATATLEDALHEALAALQRLERGTAQIDRLTQGAAPPATALAHTLALTLNQGEEKLQGTLATDSLGLMLLAGLVSHRPPARNALDDERLPIRLRAEIGRSSLPADLLASLAPQDVILIEQPWISQSGELWLGQDDFGVRVRHDDTQLIITQALATTGLTMPPPEPGDRPDAAPLALERIPVRLTFDLGERSLPLGELKALQPGQTLDLGRPLGSAVNIRANGALIGQGELIEIDGRLGVSIATLAEKGA